MRCRFVAGTTRLPLVAPPPAYHQRRTVYTTRFQDLQTSGVHDVAPRAGEDHEYVGARQALPGAHPLPLTNQQVERMSWPLVSPYMPSPQRPHPYWLEPPKEWPSFEPSVPIVYNRGSLRDRIIVPVFNLEGEVTHTRELDPYLFGEYPDTTFIDYNHTYWWVRCINYEDTWDFAREEIFRKAKKNWANTGTGMGRVSDRKWGMYHWGAHRDGQKPWNLTMPTMIPWIWTRSNRMMLTLKMLQGKLQIVDSLSLPEPSVEAFKAQCAKMKWDVRHTGAGVLFMDGGSRLTPAMEFNPSFFYGSFHNGRNKVVRPTIHCEEPYDFMHRRGTHPNYFGPRGQKNPVPINRFNCYDALEHHLLVVTEGALLQLEQEGHPDKLKRLPPHILAQVPQSSPLLGDGPFPLEAIELEAAGRIEEAQRPMYEPFYDNPYKPWADEGQAGYEVDPVEGVVRRHVPGSELPGSWRVLE